ncbi:hypothetical protein NL676_028088 [Syzygium grande]|nr:hypothetical protein NL676_028088 [Syzygium grande]
MAERFVVDKKIMVEGLSRRRRCRLLSFLSNFIVSKLNLTIHVVPSANVAAGLLGFAMVESWTCLLGRPYVTGRHRDPDVRHGLFRDSNWTASYMLGISSHIVAIWDTLTNPIRKII